MKWEHRQPGAGDILRTKVGPLYHYGICVGVGEVIQFGKNPALRHAMPDGEIQVCQTDLKTFLCGQLPEVGIPEEKERSKRFAPDRTVALARQRLGETGYHILYNNCEHFAYECYLGESRSDQTERVRDMFRNMITTDVYIAPLGQAAPEPVEPPLRQEQIENTVHEGLKRQRYYVWKLLEYGLNRSYGLKLQDLHFSREKDGKWSCRECFFSLSHSFDAVAVAISRQPVGVDIECVEHIISEGLGDKILTQREQLAFEAQPSEDRRTFLLEKWCAKESLYKAGICESFVPQKMETDDVRTGTIRIGQRDYCYAVAAKDLSNLRVYENISL